MEFLKIIIFAKDYSVCLLLFVRIILEEYYSLLFDSFAFVKRTEKDKNHKN